ncbi:MAG: NAD(+) synthase [Bacillota bacterium]|nr:NAD(+) synthase [Bacillota bacterium]
MYDFLRTAVAVPKLTVGDTASNAAAVIEMAREADRQGADLVVFPELCLTGYTCADLFFQRTLLEGAVEGLRRVIEASEKMRITAAVGIPLIIRGQLYNCAAVVSEGKVWGIVPKTFIANYNEFYEKRWFSSAEKLTTDFIHAEDLGYGDYDIPVGQGIIFDIGGAKFGIEICEDLWVSAPPSSFLALNGAEIILNLSASNETIAKRRYRRDLISQQSAKTISGYVYCSSGADESTTDLVYSGHGLIAENGVILADNDALAASDYLLVKDIDLGKLRTDRVKITSFSDCASLYGSMYRCRDVNIHKKFPIRGNGELYYIQKLPFVPSSKKDRLERCLDIFGMQSSGLKKRMSVVGVKPVIGISGGLDSTLALLVCAHAVKNMGQPLSTITGITMPCFGTSDRTYKNSLEFMKKLGITTKEINITQACTKHCEDIGHDINKFDVTFENIQARERTQVLMDYASETGGFVVGTGDLSELALGWCTYNADHMSMYGVNSGVPKTLVRWMIDSVIEYSLFPDCTEVLLDIIDTPISPELLPPDETGNITQETESIIGPYALHDFFLYYMVRFGFNPKKIYHLACIAFKDDFDKDIILKWLKTFYTRFFSQQFKRSCLPDGVKVGSICLSPRGDWRMPSDASAKIWLNEVDSIS